MRRVPTDLSEYYREIMAGNAEPTLPKRRRVDGSTNGGPIVTNTPKAIWWLFSRRSGPEEESRPVGSFKNFDVINPEIYWQPWNRPSQGLSIDRCIEDLINASEIAQNRSDKEIVRPKRGVDSNTRYKKNKLTNGGSLAEVADANGDFDKWDCPYAFVRWRLAEAIGLAYDDDKIDDDLRNLSKGFRGAIKDIESARSKITAAIEKITPLNYIHSLDIYARIAADRNMHKETNSLKKTLSLIDSNLSDLNLIKDKFPAGGRPAVWWRSFVKNCGIIWTTLTGKVPTVKKQGFIDFVNAANESLGGKRGQLDSQISTAIEYFEKANPWDRLDAESKGILAPGHSPMQYLGLDHPRHPDNMWRNRLLNKIEKIKYGDLSVIPEISSIYMMASEESKALIIEILDEHGVLAQFHGSARFNH